MEIPLTSASTVRPSSYSQGPTTITGSTPFRKFHCPTEAKDRIDGAQPQSFNGTSPYLYYNATCKSCLYNEAHPAVYSASNLTDGPHTLALTNLGNGPAGTALDVDYAIVNSSTTPVITNTTGTNGTVSSNVTSTIAQASSTSTSKSTTTTTPTHKASNAGAIAGGVVGGLAALAILAALLWFFCIRKQQSYKSARRDPVDLNGEANEPESDGGEDKPFQTNSYATTSAPTSQMTQTGPVLSAIPPPPPSDATSYPRSAPTSSGSQYGYDDFQPLSENTSDPHRQLTSDSSPVRTSVPGSSSSSRTAPIAPLAPPVIAGSAKVPAVALPFTARQPVSPERMNIPGREQDMGPIPMQFSDDGHDHDGPLPPDYQQATEPLPGQAPESRQ